MVNLTDFSQAQLLDAPGKNIFENVLKGYQVAEAPRQMAREANARELANKFKQMELEHKPKEYALSDRQKELENSIKEKANSHYEEKFKLEQEAKKAQIQHLLQKQIGGNPKANAELANFLVAHPNATPEEIRKAEEEIRAAKTGRLAAMADRSRDITVGAPFDKLPVNDKKQIVGLFKGMGVDPIEATRLARSGVTPTEYAKENNIDIANVTPDYALGEQNIKDVQRISAYSDEIDNLQRHVSEGLGPFQNKIMGYSFKQIADMADGKNQDLVARSLAARALVPELGSLRLKIMGGNTGIEALRELEKKSLSESRVFESLVDSKTYALAQKYMDEWIREAAQTRTKTLTDFGKLKKHLNKPTQSNMDHDPLGLR